MAHSSGSKTQIAFIAESTWGTTPSTPTMQSIPYKSFNLKPVMETYSSAQMNPSRQKTILATGVLSASAELTAEFVVDVFDPFLESAFCSAFTAGSLKIGTTPKFFTIEEGHADIASFHTGNGMLATKFSLSVKPGFVECIFSYLGKAFSVATTTGATAVTAIPDDDSTVTMNATLSEGGSAIATITSLDFTLENSVDLGKPCNAATASGFAVGMAKVTGKLNAYFENDTLLSKFLAGTASTIEVDLGNGYVFTLPNIMYTASDTPVDKEGLLAVALDFEAIYDDTSESVVVVTKNPG